MRSRIVFLVGALPTFPASVASNGMDVVRDLAGRVDPIVGAALSCRDRADLASALHRSITGGTIALTAGKSNCATAGKQFAELTLSFGRGQHQASQGTALDDTRIYQPIELE
jgi:branched-chain amino acid transport system substrate-binding protein